MLGGINETDLALLPAPSSYLSALPRNPLGSGGPLTPSPLRRGALLRPGPDLHPFMAPPRGAGGFTPYPGPGDRSRALLRPPVGPGAGDGGAGG